MSSDSADARLLAEFDQRETDNSRGYSPGPPWEPVEPEEPAFLQGWPAASRQLFDRLAEKHCTLFESGGFSLQELLGKVARQTALTCQQVNEPFVTPEGELSIGAKLHATLFALQRLVYKAEKLFRAEMDATPRTWLKVRTTLAPPRLRAGFAAGKQRARVSARFGAARDALRRPTRLAPGGPAGPTLQLRCVAFLPAVLTHAPRFGKQAEAFLAPHVQKAASAKRVAEPPAAEHEVKEEEPAAAVPAGKRSRRDDDAASAVAAAATAAAAAAVAAQKAAAAASAAATAALAAAESAADAARHAQHTLDCL